VEDAWRGEYRCKQSYRLVKPVPVEQDLYGYRSSGELFEEFVNFQEGSPARTPAPAREAEGVPIT